MWTQNYTPLAGNLALSAIMAALPAFAMLYLLGIKRLPAWKASVAGLGAAVVVALFVYRMPVGLVAGSVGYGAAFGLFPIGWIIFSAILLYRVAVESGKFEIIKDSLGSLTQDRRLQALLIAFCFGAFLESAAGFGTPVAVAATMLIGLGFSPFYAASLCLLANTVPVTFGSIGIPVITLSAVTNLPINSLSGAVGLICLPASLLLPAYIILVMGGLRRTLGRRAVPDRLLCRSLSREYGKCAGNPCGARHPAACLEAQGPFRDGRRPLDPDSHQAPSARRGVLGLESLLDSGDHGHPVGRVQDAVEQGFDSVPLARAAPDGDGNAPCRPSPDFLPGDLPIRLAGRRGHGRRTLGSAFGGFAGLVASQIRQASLGNGQAGFFG
jgi:hypothetical protein